MDGSLDGSEDGWLDGDSEGVTDGTSDGKADGKFEGEIDTDGDVDGLKDGGSTDGIIDGSSAFILYTFHMRHNTGDRKRIFEYYDVVDIISFEEGNAFRLCGFMGLISANYQRAGHS